MDNDALSLQNFSSIFEILAGYYLLLGTSKKFSDYFNVGSIFKKWVDSYVDIEKLVERAKLIEEVGLNLLPQSNPQKTIEDQEKWEKARKIELARLKKKVAYAKKLANSGTFVKEQVGLHFGKDHNSEEEETVFYEFIKPFYIFFGCLSLAFLGLSGFYTEWQKIHTVHILVVAGGFIWFIMFIQILGNIFFKTRHIIYDPILTYVVSIIILGLIAVIPCRWYDSLLIFPNDIDPSVITYSDLQIFSSAVLVFLPITTHMLTLAFVIGKFRRVKKLVEMSSDYLQLLENKNIGGQIPTPPTS